MIIDEALHPSMSRGGYDHATLVPLGNSDPSDFPQTSEGLWLPYEETAARELKVAKERLGAFAVALGDALDEETEAATEAITLAEIVEGLGCWRPAGLEDDDAHTANLWELGVHDMGTILNPKDSATKDRLHICETEQCLNTRHYDFTFGVSQRHELLEPDLRCYRWLDDGRILTAWGDVLPSVRDSIAEFRKLQQLCPPYASEKTSPLTANGISKITIDEHTGCWAVRTYYTKPPSVSSWQYDGYGRLTMRKHMMNPRYRTTGAQALAHRVVWKATGRKLVRNRELNHLCGFRPCANPLHIQQVTRTQNNQHGRQMQYAIAQLGP